MVKTYNPKDIIVTLGAHIVTGYADDSFVSIEANGDGITNKVGCQGEVVRSISPDDTCVVKIVLLMTSDSNSWLQSMHNRDKSTGDGMFPVLIKNNRGGLVFSTANAWVTKSAPRNFGKEAGNTEWEIHTDAAELEE